MGERSGVGVVEFAILEALDSRGARSGRRPAGNARVLADVEERLGLAPGYAYEVLLDLARPWKVPVWLVDGFGNYGDLTGGPHSEFRHTMARLSAAGEVAVAAERGELAPVPIGLINGNTYRDGRRPPFRPAGIIEAVRQVIRQPRVTSKELVDIIGVPDFPTGCAVTGDLAALAAGRPAVLRLQARVTIGDLATVAAGRPPALWLQARVTGDDHRIVVVENMPPNADRDDLILRLADQSDRTQRRRGGRAGSLPLAEVVDSSLDGNDQFICIPEPGTPPELLRDQLADFDGITTTLPAAFPRSLPAMVRSWARAYPGEDLLASLTSLEDAIRIQRARR
jgi:hypothetical protein